MAVPVKLSDTALVEVAREDGSLPATVEVGYVFRRVAMLMRDGKRWHITVSDHTRIRITAIPGGRRRTFSYVKVDPRGMGNGRADRGVKRCDLMALARHYAITDG